MTIARTLPTLKWVLLIAFAVLHLVQMTIICFVATLATPEHQVGDLTLANYANIWTDPNLSSAFGNSIAYVLINICITVPVAIPAAYAFSRISLIGDKQLFFAFRITPPVVLTLRANSRRSCRALITTRCTTPHRSSCPTKPSADVRCVWVIYWILARSLVRRKATGAACWNLAGLAKSP